MRKALIVFGASVILLPLLLVGSYFAAIRWAPIDALRLLPQNTRNDISHELIAESGFDAKSFSAAKRAVKLNPKSEEAWTYLCATGVSDGKDINGALEACSRASAMTTSPFYAQVIAEAYEEAHRPCDGLPVLKKMMGEEKVNNISPIFQVARLEVTCGEMDAAENHLRTVVRLRREDLRANGWEDRPPSPGEYAEDTYEKAFRMNLSKARENLSALLSMRHEDAEAFQVCRAAIGLDMKRCICQFQPRGGTACHASKEADDVAPEVSSIARAGH